MSISEVKAAIAQNQDAVETCTAMLRDVIDRVHQREDHLGAVTAESRNDDVEQCLTGFSGARDGLEQVIQSLYAGQAHADAYAARI